MERGQYGEIQRGTIRPQTLKTLDRLLRGASRSEHIDEHGGWVFDCDFDRHGRGHATNYDYYGYGRDCHSRRLLAVIQIRRFTRQRKNGWGNQRKSYFLIGRNEDETYFAHPVSAGVIHSAIKSGRNVVRACQDWIFGGDYGRMVRQGDFAFLPVRKPGADAQCVAPARILQESHYLIADEARKNGHLYAKNPSLYHLPGTHPDLENLPGWWRLIEGRRGRFWSFAAPTVD